MHSNTFTGVDVVDGILLWFRSDRKTGRLSQISMLLEHNVSTMILILSLKWRLKMRSYMQFDAFTGTELIRTLIHDPHTDSCILLKGGRIMRQGRPASRRSRNPDLCASGFSCRPSPHLTLVLPRDQMRGGVALAQIFLTGACVTLVPVTMRPSTTKLPQNPI